MARRALGSFSIVALLVCGALLGGAGPASAAIVANGDFETGNLEGWMTSGIGGRGGWQVYSAGEAEGGALPVPPSGNYAAVTEIGTMYVATTFLYQDVALPADTTDQLSLYLYYRSAETMSVPTPDTLFTSEAVELAVPANQQIRVDVLKPNAPIESLSPNDILATVYASKDGDPKELAPTLLSADLSAFAGQTVELRIAAAAQQGPLFVGADDVAIASAPLPPSAPSNSLPSNEFTKGKLTLDRKSGTGFLTVNLPGPGSLTSSDARRALAIASAARRKGRARPRPILIKTKTIQAGAGGVVKVPIQPTPTGVKLLRETGRVAFKVELTFAPNGGSPATQGYAGKLVKALRPAPAPR